MFHHTYVCAFADIFTCFAGELPKELGDLVNLTKLYLGGNEFEGEFVCPSRRVCCLLLTCPLLAGELPKELGDLVNLTGLYLHENEFQGEFVCSSIPRYLGTCIVCLLTFDHFLQENCPRISATSSI